MHVNLINCCCYDQEGICYEAIIHYKPGYNTYLNKLPALIVFYAIRLTHKYITPRVASIFYYTLNKNGSNGAGGDGGNRGEENTFANVGITQEEARGPGFYSEEIFGCRTARRKQMASTEYVAESIPAGV